MEELIVRVLGGDATEVEVRRLQAWRRESPDHEGTYARMLRVWEVTGTVADRPIPPPPPLAQIVEEAERRRSSVVSIAGWRARRVRGGWLTAAAAAAMVLVAVGIARDQGDRGARYATASDEHRTVTLADGSIVRMAPESVLRVRGASSRSLRLEGRAFFAVATDTARPFIVETPVGQTMVLGTRFEIASNADSLRLVVVEGRVALAASGRSVEVARGEVSRVTAGSVPSAPVTADVWALLDWPNGVLVFQATPLAEAVEQIERHFGVPFAIRDDDLAQRTVTAWFRDETLAEVVNTVCAVVGAQCAVGDTVEVMR
jgi:transmembrane sensor